jgi:hypothetical protein
VGDARRKVRADKAGSLYTVKGDKLQRKRQSFFKREFFTE